MTEHVPSKEKVAPKCYLICTRRAKYIVTSPYSLREEFICGIHAKRWLKNSPKQIRPLEQKP